MDACLYACMEYVAIYMWIGNVFRGPVFSEVQVPVGLVSLVFAPKKVHLSVR